MSVTVSPLTSEDGAELFPSLSPDGKWVVYTRDELDTGQTDILLRAVGGQTAINLTKDSTADDSQAAFSPDGERIAFRSERDGGGLFVMGRTGESVRRLTTDGFNPSWSPDGMFIVYADETTVIAPNTRFSGSALRVVSVATGERRQLSSGDGVQPSWSPHGHRIAYWALQAGKAQRDLWTVAATGGEPVRVTDDPAVDWNPVWSPDGRYLYFSSDRSGGGFNLWRVEIDEVTGQPGGEPETMAIPRSGIGHVSVSANGAGIVMASMSTAANLSRVSRLIPASPAVGSRRRMTTSSDRATTSVLCVAERAVDRLHQVSAEQPRGPVGGEAGRHRPSPGDQRCEPRPQSLVDRRRHAADVPILDQTEDNFRSGRSPPTAAVRSR